MARWNWSLDGTLTQPYQGLPEPGGRGDEVYVGSLFNVPGGDARPELGRASLPETWSSIVVHPGRGNSMHLTVEASSATDGRLVVGPPPLHAAPPKSWMLVEGDLREALQGRSFLLSLGEGRAVMLDARVTDGWRDGVHVVTGTMPTKEEVERMKAGGPINHREHPLGSDGHAEPAIISPRL